MFAIYTTEIIASRKWRMPWRTVLELAKSWGGIIFTGDGAGDPFSIDGVRIYPIEKPFDISHAKTLVGMMKKFGVTRLYYPVGPGRAYSALQEVCDASGIELVWYMPSSWNSVSRCLRAARFIGLRAALPFLKQALIPKRAWIRCLNAKHVRHLIVMSDFTARKMIEKGYPSGFVHVINPGLDPIESPRVIPTKLSKPYFLFFGPPQAIRGIYLILDAVRKLSKTRRDFLFVPLIRGDENAKAALEKLKVEMSRPEFQGVVEPRFESLSRDEINAYIDGCVAVLKPFVLVPSEIPLAPMEAIQRGKVVIGFEGDGTGEMIGRAGMTAKHCDLNSLTYAMSSALDNLKVNLSQGESPELLDWGTVCEQWRFYEKKR